MFILVVAVCFVGCSTSNEKKAQELIKQQIEFALHDFGSYENVKFGKLDSVYTTVFDDTLFMEYNFQRLTYQRFSNVAMTDSADIHRTTDMRVKYFLNNTELEFNFADSISKYRELENARKEQFVPQFAGWSMEHLYRADNVDEKNGLIHQVYVFDNDITEIITIKEYDVFLYHFNVEEKLKDMEEFFLETFVEDPDYWKTIDKWYGGSFEKPDYEKIKINIENKSSNLYYPLLVYKYQEGDSTMTLEEKRHLVYGFVYHESYSPSISVLNPEQIQLILDKENVTAKDWVALVSLLNSWLNTEPFNCRLLYYLSIAHEALNNMPVAEKVVRRMQIVGDALYSTGNGLSQETAIHVFADYHKHDYLLLNNLSMQSQRLVNGGYDVFSLMPNEYEIKELWFYENQLFKSMK